MTRASKLPALPPVQTNDVQLQRWMQAVAERLEVREGSRGDPDERVVTHREMKALGLDASQFGVSRSGLSSKLSGGVMVQGDDGSFSRVPMSAFADELRKTKLYQDLMRSINDVNRFDDVPAQVRAILLSSLADEAAARGADIRRLEVKQQSDLESIAYTVEQVTASVSGVSAGVREVAYASATANEATAGKVTQITARIDGVIIDAADILPTVYDTIADLKTKVPKGVLGKYYQVKPVPPATKPTLFSFNGKVYLETGVGNTATVEQKMIATASRTTGLEASYVVKVAAGGAVAGFGLAATDDNAGNATSAFIVQADKFAVVGSDYNGDVLNPEVSKIPFGIDTKDGTLYINGQVRIKTEGQTTPAEKIEDALKTAKLLTLSTTGYAFIFKNESATTSDSPRITVSANVTNIPDTTPVSFTARAFRKDGSGIGSIVWSNGSTTITSRGENVTSQMFQSLNPLTTKYIVVTAACNVNGTPLSDSVTIYRGDGGSSAVTAILSNEAHTIPADNKGVTNDSSFVGATTYIKIFEGVEDTTDKWTFGASAVGVTGDFGGFFDGTYKANALSSGLTFTGQTKPTVRVTGMTADTGTVTIFATRDDRYPTPYPIQTKVFSLSKSKAGVPGIAGNAGSVTLYGDGWWTNGDEFDILATKLVDTRVNREPTIGDTVTLTRWTSATDSTKTDFVTTRYWGGTSDGWLNPGVVINGNLLVGGTVSADKIGVGEITAASLNTSGYGVFNGKTDALDLGAGILSVETSVLGVAPATAIKAFGYRCGAVGRVRNYGQLGTFSYGVGVVGYAENATYKDANGVWQVSDQVAGVRGQGVGANSIGGDFYGGYLALRANGNAEVSGSLIASGQFSATANSLSKVSRAGMLESGGTTFEFPGAPITSGTKTAAMVATNKPGANNTSNDWVEIRVNGAVRYIPTWGA